MTELQIGLLIALVGDIAIMVNFIWIFGLPK